MGREIGEVTVEKWGGEGEAKEGKKRKEDVTEYEIGWREEGKGEDRGRREGREGRKEGD